MFFLSYSKYFKTKVKLLYQQNESDHNPDHIRQPQHTFHRIIELIHPLF